MAQYAFVFTHEPAMVLRHSQTHARAPHLRHSHVHRAFARSGFDWLSHLRLSHAAILDRSHSNALPVHATFRFCETDGGRNWIASAADAAAVLTKRRTVERLVVLDLVLICLGIVLGLIATRQWELVRFGCLQPDLTIRLVTCSVLFLLLGGQTTLAGFYFGLLNLTAERGIQRGKLVSEWVESTRVTANP
jgi:hypothetical protein